MKFSSGLGLSSIALLLSACATTPMPDTTSIVRTHWHGDVKLTYNPLMDNGKSVEVGVPYAYGKTVSVDKNSDKVATAVSSSDGSTFDGVRLTKLNKTNCRLEENHLKGFNLAGTDHGFPSFVPDVDVYSENVLCSSGTENTWKLP